MAKILVVEDDPDQRAEYAHCLSSPDGGSHRVEEAPSATSAVRMLRSGSYDLVLLDVMMPFAVEDKQNPEIDPEEVEYGRKMGIYVCRKAREVAKSPAIALVTVIRNRAVLAEFGEVVGYLGKPFFLQELVESVRQWLNAAEAANRR